MPATDTTAKTNRTNKTNKNKDEDRLLQPPTHSQGAPREDARLRRLEA